MPPEKHDHIHYKYNLSVYWSLVRPYLPWLMGILATVVVTELLLIAEKFIFKAVVDGGTVFEAGGDRATFVNILIIAGILFGGMVAIRTVAKWLFIHWLNRLDSFSMMALKQRYFNHLLRLSHNFHTSSKTGALISRILRGSAAMERVTDRITFDFTPLILRMVLVVGSLWYFDVPSALICIVMSLAFISYSIVIHRKQRKYNLAANDIEDYEKARMADYFTNIESVKYFGKERSVMGVFAGLTRKTKNAYVTFWDYFRWLDAGHTAILGFSVVALVWVSVDALLQGRSSIGTLVFTYTTFTSLVSPLFGFVHGIREFGKAMADFESLFRYDRVEKDVKDKKGAKSLRIRRGEVRFDNICFKYKQRLILDGFDLAVLPNTRVALVGPSGAGKSTIIKLLYRFYDVQRGGIAIDGVDVRDVRQESLRNEMSIVPQECVLFDASIYDNIAFSDPNASRAQVFAAIRFAQLDEFIKRLPLKEKTIVGERGIKLSGGEKQRVSIARAILADKKILVLDEATSSLDSETEADIQKALLALMKGRTTIIIAHRLSTIMHADVVVVLDKGHIVQMGKHEELIAQDGIYRKLWDLQKGGFIK